jgi:transcriptional regulator with XRE-family HTH domain
VAGHIRDRHAELLSLGNAIRRRRQARGMTLDDLSQAAGISRVMLVAIEHGRRNPGIRSIFELAAALGVPAAELVAEAQVEE